MNVLFTFAMCNILEGIELEFWPSLYVNSGLKCVVMNDKYVCYQKETYSLSALAQKLLDSHRSVVGSRYLKYNGEWLNSLRAVYSNQDDEK